MEGISMWDIYWVMQMDNIAAFLSVTGTVIFLTFWLTVSIGCSESYLSTKEFYSQPLIKRLAIGVTCYSVMAMTLSAFLPSSKVLAAMLLIPPLTTPQVMEPLGTEAKELYLLAKGALKSVATKEEKEDEPAAK